MWEFPADIFKQFKGVYVLTYLFDAQIQKYYYDMNNIQYDKYIVTKDKNTYSFIKNINHSDKAIKNKLKQLITIYEGSLNSIGDYEYSLSHSWYENKKHMQKALKNNILNYFQNIIKSKSEYNMWTTFKEYESKLKGKGYSKGFISCTARSTNEYSHKNTIVYALNRFLHPVIKSYFYSKGIEVKEELFALSEFIQWVWRSAIRNDEPINIYIPSQRMRKLFIQWLNDEI
jgi:hypothetical protein